MKIKVLGSSSSGNCYVLMEDGEKIILDCGVKLADIMRAIDWDTDLVKCLLTHIHRDHSESAEALVRRGVNVLTCTEVANSVAGTVCIQPKAKHHFADWTIASFGLPHGDVECYGYYIETDNCNRVLYATDYEYIPYNFKKLRLTHMLIACNYTDISPDNIVKYEHVKRGHPSLDTALGVVEANMTDALRCVILCHVSATEDGEAMREKVQELVGDGVAVYVAKKGVVIDD